MKLLLIWALILPVIAILWYFFVRGFVINWVGLFMALPGIIADLACQLWIDVSAPFRKKKEIILDEYERKLS